MSQRTTACRRRGCSSADRLRSAILRQSAEGCETAPAINATSGTFQRNMRAAPPETAGFPGDLASPRPGTKLALTGLPLLDRRGGAEMSGEQMGCEILPRDTHRLSRPPHDRSAWASYALHTPRTNPLVRWPEADLGRCRGYRGIAGTDARDQDRAPWALHGWPDGTAGASAGRSKGPRSTRTYTGRARSRCAGFPIPPRLSGRALPSGGDRARQAADPHRRRSQPSARAASRVADPGGYEPRSPSRRAWPCSEA